jgi:CheY-like chemotaxis protein
MASTLIICDVMMPRLPVDPRAAAVPFVFLTASAEVESFEHGRELRANEYVTTPFNLLQLAALIRRRLGDAK